MGMKDVSGECGFAREVLSTCELAFDRCDADVRRGCNIDTEEVVSMDVRAEVLRARVERSRSVDCCC